MFDFGHSRVRSSVCLFASVSSAPSVCVGARTRKGARRQRSGIWMHGDDRGGGDDELVMLLVCVAAVAVAAAAAAAAAVHSMPEFILVQSWPWQIIVWGWLIGFSR